VLDTDGRVLLQRRRDNDVWALPGGAVELGETIAAAIVREVEEETGCRTEVVRLTGVYSDPDQTTITYPNGDVVAYVSTCFECRYLGGEPRPTEESTDARWFPPDEAMAVLWNVHRNRLTHALERREAADWT
jgi:8-oxo-dGTP pyrophosphatase MutT (NUDIX family)